MAATKRMKRALVSVFHKDGLDEILKKLHSEGVSFVSTGGTQSFIESLGLPCDAVEDLTSYPSILGGRVKTLHPKVFGGILARRENENDQKQLAEYEIPELHAQLVPTSCGEKIEIQYPHVTGSGTDYQLDYILLEFGGRNRGCPTQAVPIKSYLSFMPLPDIVLPKATPEAYDIGYIAWEKLTALHQQGERMSV